MYNLINFHKLNTPLKPKQSRMLSAPLILLPVITFPAHKSNHYPYYFHQRLYLPLCVCVYVCVVYKSTHPLYRVLKEDKKAYWVLNTDLSVIQWFSKLVAPRSF